MDKNKIITPYINLLTHTVLISFIAMMAGEALKGTISLNILIAKFIPYLSVGLVGLVLSVFISRKNKEQGNSIIRLWIIVIITTSLLTYSEQHKAVTKRTPEIRGQAVVSNNKTTVSNEETELAKKYYSEMMSMPEWNGYKKIDILDRSISAAKIKMKRDTMRESDWYLYTYITEYLGKSSKVKIDSSEVLSQIRHYPLQYLLPFNQDISQSLFQKEPKKETMELAMKIMIDSVINSVPE
ncbi:hypothetical protein [Brenneria uluponensis]|uniref:hypothetical protein n=1 Tax=Brenneria uluponensis TaxID=3057057 RepID=UPI0028E943A3|nr:hypothetical protein [Brenneria ulupoensis]